MSNIRVAAAGLALIGASCARRAPAVRQPDAGAPPTTAAATAEAPRAKHGARAVIVIMNASFYGKSANSIEAGDSATAAAATARMWKTVREAATLAPVDSARVAAGAAEHAVAGRACNASIDCARRVGAALGARWVVMSKVSKTSNLIWYFSGQVIDVATGRFLMDDEFELKGVRDEMIPLGARSLARRVVTVTQRASAEPGAAAP